MVCRDAGVCQVEPSGLCWIDSVETHRRQYLPSAVAAKQATEQQECWISKIHSFISPHRHSRLVCVLAQELFGISLGAWHFYSLHLTMRHWKIMPYYMSDDQLP